MADIPLHRLLPIVVMLIVVGIATMTVTGIVESASLLYVVILFAVAITAFQAGMQFRGLRGP